MSKKKPKAGPTAKKPATKPKASKPMGNLVDDLRAAIESSELSRYEIAKRAGVSESVLSLFMAGKRSMTLDTAAKLTNVLDLTLTHSR